MAVGNVVCRSRVIVFDHFRLFTFPTYSHILRNNEERLWRRLRHCRHLSTISDVPPIEHKQEVVVEYRKGLPTLRVPLPTSRKPCLFIVRPVANTVQDLLDMIKNQDQAIHDLSFSDKDDCLIATSNRIDNLLEDDFKLHLNGNIFYVKVPLKEDVNKEDLERLGEIKSLVHALYSSLNVEDHVAERERDILQQLGQIKTQLEPLEKKKVELDALATRRTTALTWVGLGLMSVQFGILARLTWWEYSWDIMEPVTYFVTYGTAMAAYAYFVLTKQEYMLPDVRDRQHLITVHKRAAKIGLDLNEYNRLKARLYLLESHLNRMKEPQLPPPLPAHSLTTPKSSFSLANWLRTLSRK